MQNLNLNNPQDKELFLYIIKNARQLRIDYILESLDNGVNPNTIAKELELTRPALYRYIKSLKKKKMEIDF